MTDMEISVGYQQRHRTVMNSICKGEIRRAASPFTSCTTTQHPLTMNLGTLPSPCGQFSGASCALSSILALGCRSRSEAPHTLAEKLWSLGPATDPTTLLDPSWALESRFNYDTHRVETVVTSVCCHQLSPLMDPRNRNFHQQQAPWMMVQSFSEPPATDSDSSSTTTSNTQSDSDQYFDFGIESPSDSAGEDDTLCHDPPIVINEDDGLPAQLESGFIFSSPADDGSDIERDQEASLYESLNNSPAAAADYLHKQFSVHLSDEGESIFPGESKCCVDYQLSPVSNGDAALAHCSAQGRCSVIGRPQSRVHPARVQGDLKDIDGDSNSDNLAGCGSPAASVPQLSAGLDALEKFCGENVKELPDGNSDMVRHDPIDQVLDASDVDGHLCRATKDAPEAVDHVTQLQLDLDSATADSVSRSIVRDISQEPQTNTPLEPEDDDEQLGQQLRRVQRSTSLKTGKTPPGTPGCKKIVRFADALGLDLAAVRTFLDEVPNVPQSAFSDLKNTETENALSQSFSQICVTNRMTGGASMRSLVASFAQPSTLPDFLERVKQQRVCLETAAVVDDFNLHGVVRVLNLDFHKSVLIRYTCDEWKTQGDLLSAYVPGSCDGLSDRFSFKITFPQSLNIGQRLIFAVCYRVAGQEIWDSNQGKNYVFHCISNSSYLPSIALQPSLPSEGPFSESCLPYM